MVVKCMTRTVYGTPPQAEMPFSSRPWRHFSQETAQRRDHGWITLASKNEANTGSFTGEVMRAVAPATGPIASS